MTDHHRPEALRERAHALGVETSYWDVTGHYHEAPESTLRLVVDVLEADRAPVAARQLEPVVVGRPGHVDVGRLVDVVLVLADGTSIELPVEDGRAAVPPDLPFGCHVLRAADVVSEESTTLIVAPATMGRAAHLDGRAGLFVPTYALWESGSPLPSYAHLAAFTAKVRQLGIDVVSTLPLYAAFLDDPFDPSPYSPISRLHWNEVYLDDSALPAAPMPAFGDLIDWRALARRRRTQLLDASADLDPYIQAGIDRFVADRPDVADFARFRAAAPDPADAGRPAALVQRSHLLAQYLAHRQLGAVEGPERAQLALDLPIGSHPAGYETWTHPDRFAGDMVVGAPPDEFFSEGQNWGFPPQLPGAGRRSGHALWQQLVARAGEHASLLRIDHVMGVQRLWWVPAGASPTDGVYVRYPREEILAVIAAEAARTGTTIVGENLGTVPEEVSEALERWDVLGLHEEQFSLYQHHHGSGGHLGPIPARSVAGVRTHDMPAFAAAFNGDATGSVYEYRRLVEEAVGHGVGDEAADVFDAVLERLAGSDAYLVLADVDDLLGEVAPHNVPGVVLESTWRRRLRRPTSGMLADGDVRRRLKLLSTRPRPGREAT
ncbi:MAG: 4-alpha-glucanotransferase [Ilumatobacteraceae bacterium]